jgi:hypothetical protein
MDTKIKAAAAVRHIKPAGYQPPAPKPYSARPPSLEEQRQARSRQLEQAADRLLRKYGIKP